MSLGEPRGWSLGSPGRGGGPDFFYTTLPPAKKPGEGTLASAVDFTFEEAGHHWHEMRMEKRLCDTESDTDPSEVKQRHSPATVAIAV